MFSNGERAQTQSQSPHRSVHGQTTNSTTNDSHSHHSHSPSPHRGLGEKISAFGSRLSRTFSGGGGGDGSSTVGEKEFAVGALVERFRSSGDRSISRGREGLTSTGRGGFGNIRDASVSRDRSAGGPDDFSVTRGREPVPVVKGGGLNPSGSPVPVYSTGRGGAGNLRSPSRGPARETSRGGVELVEKEVIQHYIAEHVASPISTGRGGLGNINRSRSREPGSAAQILQQRAVGRGGAGNVHLAGDAVGYGANGADEVERRRADGAHVHDGFHSTGRGGFANITEKEEPGVEEPAPVGRASLSSETTTLRSTGRGGAGNKFLKN